MMSHIGHGDHVKCLNCGKTILVYHGETLLFDFLKEYIVCNHCKATYDVHAYLIFGEKVLNEGGE